MWPCTGTAATAWRTAKPLLGRPAEPPGCFNDDVFFDADITSLAETAP